MIENSNIYKISGIDNGPYYVVAVDQIEALNKLKSAIREKDMPISDDSLSMASIEYHNCALV